MQAKVYVMGQYRGTREVADDSLVGLLARWAAGEPVEGLGQAVAGALGGLRQLEQPTAETTDPPAEVLKADQP